MRVRPRRRCDARRGARDHVPRAEGQRRLGRTFALRARRAALSAALVDSARVGMPQLRAGERGRRAFLQRVRNRARRRRAGPRAAQGRHRSLLRPRRLDRARRVDRPGGAPCAHAPLLRGSPRDHRAPRRDRREVRRRCGDGRLRDPGLARGRRAPRGSGRCGDARGDLGSTGSRRGSASTREKSSSAARARRSSPATPSTSPLDSSRRPQPARRSSAPRRAPRSRRRRRRARRAARAQGKVGAGRRPSASSRSLTTRPRSRVTSRRRSSAASGRNSASGAPTRTRSPTAPVSSSRSSGLPASASRASSPTSSSASGDSSDVLRGRCLSYGEGITYWPLVEILIAYRRRAGLDHRHVTGRDAARVPPAAREPAPPSDRRSS